LPGGKGGRCVGLITLLLSCADCLKIWESQPPGYLRACPGITLPLKIIFQLPTMARESKRVKFAVLLNISTTVRSACGELSVAEIYMLMSSRNLKKEPAWSSACQEMRNKIRLRVDSLFLRKYFISTVKAKKLRMHREILLFIASVISNT
jgi:hypothetical protein